MKRPVKQSKKTFFSFLLWALIALGLFFLLQNTNVFDSFQANILSLNDRNTLIEHDRDIWYRTDNHVLDVYLSDTWDAIASLEVEILYDASKISFDFEMMKQQWLVEIVGKEDWKYLLSIKNIPSIDSNESLFVLPYTWDASALLLWSVVAFDTVWSGVSLSVGNLNISSITNGDIQVHKN